MTIQKKKKLFRLPPIDAWKDDGLFTGESLLHILIVKKSDISLKNIDFVLKLFIENPSEFNEVTLTLPLPLPLILIALLTGRPADADRSCSYLVLEASFSSPASYTALTGSSRGTHPRP